MIVSFDFKSAPVALQDAYLEMLQQHRQGSKRNELYSTVVPLDVLSIERFMSGVSDTTEKSLELFVKHPTGEPALSEFMALNGYEQWQQTRGLLSGLTKRVRTITSDSTANFYDYRSGPTRSDEANGEWEDSPIYLHPVTLQSLKTYFERQRSQ